MDIETDQSKVVNYDAETFEDGDILLNKEVNINPEFYIHCAIQKTQQALLKDNLNEGLLQYRLLVEQIEIICRSAGIIDTAEYFKAIEEFKKTDEYQKEEKDLIKHSKLAGEKLRLLLEEVFNNKVSTQPLKA